MWTPPLDVDAGACADNVAIKPALASAHAASPTIDGTMKCLRIWRRILTYFPAFATGAMVCIFITYSGYIVSAPPRVGSNGRLNFAANSRRN